MRVCAIVPQVCCCVRALVRVRTLTQVCARATEGNHGGRHTYRERTRAGDREDDVCGEGERPDDGRNCVSVLV